MDSVSLAGGVGIWPTGPFFLRFRRSLRLIGTVVVSTKISSSVLFSCWTDSRQGCRSATSGIAGCDTCTRETVFIIANAKSWVLWIVVWSHTGGATHSVFMRSTGQRSLFATL